MEIEPLTEQLLAGQPLPGLAFMVARDVVESAVIAGGLHSRAAANLRIAAEHLGRLDDSCTALRAHPSLVDELMDVAATRHLEPARLSSLRNALRDLVSAVPVEGSVSPDVEYVGF
jgi:hypothetical protein